MKFTDHGSTVKTSFIEVQNQLRTNKMREKVVE